MYVYRYTYTLVTSNKLKKIKYDIKAVNLELIETPNELHSRLKEKLELPAFYAENWDAFWDCITGLIELPEKFIFYNINNYSKRHPEDSKKLSKIIHEYNSRIQEEVIEFDFTEGLPIDKEFNTIESIFSYRPFQYGLRGDPPLWDDLEEYFKSIPTPTTEELLIEQIYSVVKYLTNNDLSLNRDFFVEKYNHGGMSTGTVCAEFWIKRGIPLIIGRYRTLMKSW